MFTLVLLLFTFLAIFLHLLIDKNSRSKKQLIEITLQYFLIICVGFGGIFAFIAYTFNANDVANSIGWTASPFQFELAMAYLAFGILGLLCLKFKRGFWLATGLGAAIFHYGSALLHIQNMGVSQNIVPNILIPSIILILLFLLKLEHKHSVHSQK